MEQIQKYISLGLLIAGLVGSGCRQELPTPDSNEIRFVGSVKQEHLLTRANTPNTPPEEGYTLITNDKYSDQTFHIYMKVGDNANTPAEPVTSDNIIPYTVASGTSQGELVTQGNATPLNWQDKTSQHTFHSWTEPAGVDRGNETNADTDITVGTVDFTQNNNAGLEYFIGTKMGPTSHREGIYAPLKFEHLVCKVQIVSITHIRSDGSIDQNGLNSLKDATIFFPDIPQKATFDTGIRDNKNPSVAIPEKIEEDYKGINLDIKSTNPFYLPPFKFEEYGQFRITLTWNDNDGEQTYNGHLKNINASFNELGNGERMGLWLTLEDRKVTGFASYIVDWNEAQETTITRPAKPGIYTLEDLTQLVQALSNGNSESVPKEFFAPGDKTIPLFNNITLPEGESLTLTLPNDCTFDGQGHNISGSFTISGKHKNLYLNGKKQEENIEEGGTTEGGEGREA